MKKTAGTSPRGLCEDERCERGDVAAVARTMAQLDDAKYAKSLLKKLRQIEELKALRRLDAAQRQKLQGESALRAKLAELGVDAPPPSSRGKCREVGVWRGGWRQVTSAKPAALL